MGPLALPLSRTGGENGFDISQDPTGYEMDFGSSPNTSTMLTDRVGAVHTLGLWPMH